MTHHLPLVPEEEIGAALSGKILNIHRLTANSPALLSASAAFRNYLVAKSALTDRQRELLILRLAHRRDSDYEWAHHVVRGRKAGLTDDEIGRVKQYPTQNEWLLDDSIIFEIVDQTVDNTQIDTETAESSIQILGRAGFVDAIFTIGYYITLGTLLKTCAVPIESSIPTL